MRLSPVWPRKSGAKNAQPVIAQEPCSAEAPSAA